MEEVKRPKNFIEEFIEEDMRTKEPRVQTRFPPEPNGYLHIGHAKALAIDFGMAERFGGICNLRFDDTNPAKEDVEYVDAIQADIQWLGFRWNEVLFGSSYFDQCYDLAVKLIQKGVAYVDELTKDEMRAYRGTLTQAGKNSPYRDRPVAENLDLFERMRGGEFADGTKTLRAKIDMASPNINMRDPALYRIKHVSHHQTGDKWCIYPMYDFAHPIQDAIEGVTHSLCSLEYEAHRPLYDWVIDQCEFSPKPRQIEFARLNMTDTIMSKRYLRRLVEEGFVSGWDGGAPHGGAGPRSRGDRQLGRRENRGDRTREPPEPSRAGHAKGEARQTRLYRAGRFFGKPAEQVLPSQAGRRGTPQERVYHQVHRLGSKRRRRDHEDSLHL